MRETSGLRFAVGNYQLIDIKTVSFGEVFKSVCLLVAAQSSLKTVAGYLPKRRLDALSCVTSTQFFECLCQYRTLPQSEWEKRKEVSSFRYTSLSWFAAFVAGRHWIKAHFSSEYSRCTYMEPDAPWSSYSIPAPITFQPYTYLIIFWPNWTADDLS